jgi:hypothetical protein
MMVAEDLQTLHGGQVAQDSMSIGMGAGDPVF